MTPHQTLDFDACYRAASARDTRFDGRFYTAVTSTGIYCRPVCPARTPARRNVRFYPHAAAAEAAGFRPCRRCRPELSPGDPGWDVAADLVGRALRLIDDGVADEYGVAGLAGRLHITERHLLRLFSTRIGAGPLAVARTRRLLLAKQLLTETALPISDVAFAAGFGSLRQFNATLKDAYGFTPSDLRASSAGRATTAAGPPGGGPAALTLRLSHRAPYDAATLFAFLAARAVPGVEEATATTYRRTVPGGTITLVPAADHVRLTVAVDDTRRLARVVARCRRLLDLDADPLAIAAALAPTSLRPLVTARPGLRVPGAFDGFELAVRAVVGQQISVAGARTLLGRIAARAGAPVRAGTAGTGEGPDLLFPDAGRLAGADLSGLGLTGRRIATLRTLAERVATGEIDLDGGADPAQATARLLAVPGIGPWTAGYIAMRALRDPDAWPAGDLGLRRAMAALDIPDDDIERWRPWRAYAALHLWSSE
ncbi:AraC family transcriptional regulator [Sphaerisporangium rufum]|uniref:DNA-3-methyladenine glycosylase II n=1 Tax=Sphaerisporangium rufum TaxID=1381558 RepID=A0A919QWP1_9ACTN|nr:AlkA N-terminal domain-containing protein [Sphaerisporangium rufum]GII75486.1 AraC family transcriptional regulator [Sphaerisporangium rufum]